MSKTAAVDFGAAFLAAFPENVEREVELARFSSARIGGPAEWLATATSKGELEALCDWLWTRDIEFLILGGGSNVLIGDEGIRGVTILNHAKRIRFEELKDQCVVYAESGANLGALARQAAQQGWSGLEWAAGIPGTLGGAIVGNAGAHGGDMTDVLLLANILHREHGRRDLAMDELQFAYRTSILKETPGQAVVLSGELRLRKQDVSAIQAQMDDFLQHRRKTQPPGASMGSMFKNPKNDFAGRLIEEAGLKGKKIGDAQISPLHGNFFLNLGNARAKDVFQLISEARARVKDSFGVELELEIALIGEGFD